MKLFPKKRFWATLDSNRLTFDATRDRVDDRGVAVLLRNAAVTAPQQRADTVVEGMAGTWPDNCNDPSRMAQYRGNVKVLTKEKCQVLADRNGWSIERAKGFVDGESCRARGKKPSKYVMIGIDEYSLGFRAGYYERRNGVPRATEVRQASDAVQ